MFAGNFPPAGWEFCRGQLLPISEYDTLFVLIGTTYGGDGQTTFGLPDLRGRIPIHQGAGPGLSTYTLGQAGGVEEVTLSATQIPAHTHTLNASSNNGSTSNAPNNVLATTSGFDMYFDGIDAGNNLATNAINSVGGSQPHENMQPFLCVSFIISLFGVFPQQS